METHAQHLHKAPSHGWKHYLFEFLMLFLAVFCGFLAENFRESRVNREVEKNNIKSFIINLHEDSIHLVQSIEVNEKRFGYLDSLFYLKNDVTPNDIFQKQFIYYMLRLGFLSYFNPNETAFKQMQSSGTLRLIRHSKVLDSILSYEVHNEHIKQQEAICSTWWNKAIEQISSIIDLTPLAHLPPESLWSIPITDLDSIHLTKFSKNLSLLQSYYNWRVNERISLGYYIQYLKKQLVDVKELIPFLQKEYQLK
jgi:hypothetical protein